MVEFKAVLEKFREMGEKTGWTFIYISLDIAQKLNPGVRKAYRVKGKLDDFKIKDVSLLPMGNGDFILA